MDQSSHRPEIDHTSIQPEEALVRSYFHLGPVLTEFQYHDDCCFSPDGQNFVVISNSNMISIFRCEGCKLEKQIPNKKYGSTRVCYHQSKHAIYFNSHNEINDHAARLLNIQTQGFIRYFTMGGHTAPITSLASKANGVVTSSQDRTVKLWDDNVDKCVITLDLAHPGNIALHPNGLCLAVTTDTAVCLYDTRKLDNFVASTRLLKQADYVPHFGMKGTKLAVVGPDVAQEYNLSDLSLRFSLEKTMGKQTPGFSFTPDEEFMLIPTNDYSILVADTGSGSQATVLSGHHSPITSISFSSAYHNFVSTGSDCLFWTVDMTTYNLLIGHEQ